MFFTGPISSSKTWLKKLGKLAPHVLEKHELHAIIGHPIDKPRFYQRLRGPIPRLSIPLSPKKKAFILGFACLVGLLTLSWQRGYFDPYVSADDIVVSNITDASVTISWHTDKPARGRAVVSNTGFYPWNKKLRARKDDILELAHRDVSLDTHHITVGGLYPGMTYGVKVYNGFWRSQTYKFTTLKEIGGLSSPNPAYGRIVDSNRQSGVGGAIVYLIAQSADKKTTLSTISDNDGHWQIDLSNLRFSVGSSVSIQDPTLGLEMLVEAGERGRVKSALLKEKLAPANDIVLRENPATIGSKK